MDVDSEGAVLDAAEEEEEEDVPLTTMTLVGANDLERTFRPFFWSQFRRTAILQRPNLNTLGFSPPTYIASVPHRSR